MFLERIGVDGSVQQEFFQSFTKLFAQAKEKPEGLRLKWVGRRPC